MYMTTRPIVRGLVAAGALAWLGSSSGGISSQAAPPAPATIVSSGTQTPEWVQKIHDVLTSNNPRNPAPSPLYLSKTRLDWAWLAKQHGLAADGTLTRGTFRGPGALFDRLDRDGDGILGAGDFDWSGEAPFVRREKAAFALFNRANVGANGHLASGEWQALFKMAAGGKGYLTPEDLQKILHPPATPSQGGMRSAGKIERLMGFFAGELGSPHEGPDPGAVAPDFTLATPDGKKQVTLSAYQGNKPVVLIFGNFT
jgi:hypothetical protein